MTARNRRGDGAGVRLAGRYELIARIGAGAMAEVYEAHDRTLDRSVAVKVLRAQYATDPEFLGRFRQEARIAAGLSHPHLLNIHDLGEEAIEPGGAARPYIVMELVPGVTLAQEIERGRIAVDRAFLIARQIASAVALAHRKNLVHRDLKPQNILLTQEGEAKVADFGLAQEMTSAPITQPGTVWGTAQYLAPERAQGEPAGIPSDIYALGVILYEMLAGRPPFDGGSVISILNRHVHEEPDALGDREPAFRGAVERVVMRALAKAPSDRYETMDAFAAALDLRRESDRSTSAVRAGPGRGAANLSPSGGLDASGPGRRTTTVSPVSRPPGTFAPATFGTSAAVPRRGEWAGGEKQSSVSQAPAPGRGLSPRTRLLVITSILVFFGLMGVGAFLARAIMPTTAPPAPMPLPTIAPTVPAPTEVPLPTSTAVPTVTPTVLVPVVTGSTTEKAKESLANVGLGVEIVEEWNREVALGTVATQDPVAGSTLTRGKSVKLVVSRGIQRLQVPNMIGRTMATAREELVKVGLKVEVIEEFSSIAVAGIVFDQQPRGSEIDASQAVVIRVSRGREQVRVPRVTGMTSEIARRILERDGLKPVMRYEPYVGVEPDIVFASDPPADAMAYRGSDIVVRVRRDQPNPPMSATGTATRVIANGTSVIGGATPAGPVAIAGQTTVIAGPTTVISGSTTATATPISRPSPILGSAVIVTATPRETQTALLERSPTPKPL